MNSVAYLYENGPTPWQRVCAVMSERLPGLVPAMEQCVSAEQNKALNAKGHPPETAMEIAQEAALVEAILGGDGDGFRVLVDRYSQRIYSHIYGMVRNREEAEDLTQEAFLRAYRFLHRYDGKRAFRNWLYTIATNVTLNAVRSGKRREVAGEALRSDPVVEKVTDETARSRVKQTEQQDRIGAAIAQLSPKAAMLLQLHYQEGLTMREAAVVMDMSESAVKVQIHRARKRMRELLVDKES